MIYGQLAKSISTSTRKGVVISESDAILEFLQDEVNRYNDPDERAILEAKYQVLQEAAIGAIVAAIIAAIAAVVGVFIAIAKLMKKGSETAAAKAKEVKAKVEKDAKDSKVDEPPPMTKEEERIQKIIAEYNDAISVDDNKAMLSKFSNVEINHIKDECYGTTDLAGLSTVDLSEYVEVSSLEFLSDSVKQLNDPKESTSSKTEKRILHMFGEDGVTDKAVNRLLFSDRVANGVKNNNSVSEIFTTIYNRGVVEFDKILNDLSGYTSKIDGIYKNSQKNIDRYNKILSEIQRELKKYKDAGIKKYEDKNIGIQNTGTMGPGAKQLIIDYNNKEILKLTSLSTKKLESFVNTWQSIETKRLTFMTTISTKAPLLIRSMYKRRTYESFARKYGDDFTKNVSKGGV
jgi:hypothetical protein